MGRKNGPMRADYPVGMPVRVAPEAVLRKFMRPTWAFHNPLEGWQLRHAGEAAFVESVSYYHGGEELYVLRGISKGIWHEECLEAV